jgi:hypothetical protein
VSLLDDVMKLFDRWDEGQRMRAAPGRVDELEKRVAELEAKLGGKYPPNVCRFCGDRAARLHWSGSVEKGFNREEWKCETCGAVDVQTVKAGGSR